VVEIAKNRILKRFFSLKILFSIFDGPGRELVFIDDDGCQYDLFSQVKFIEVPSKRHDSKLSRGIDNIGSTTGVSILDGLIFWLVNIQKYKTISLLYTICI
jgi:hypothetical protein